jgi:hypothetical protein
VCERIRRRWPRCHRNYASGAEGGGDMAEGPAGVAWEVKRTNRLRMREAWRQLEADAAVGDLMPVLAHRWDRGPWLATVELDELLALLALREGV